MSSVESRTQKFTQGLIKKQSGKWYEQWSENWMLWIVIVILVLFIVFWIFTGQELPDICIIKSDSESELEELEELEDLQFCESDSITINPFTGLVAVEPDNCEPSPRNRKFGSKGEQITCETLESIYGMPFPTVRPNFLKNPDTKRNLELDCYNEDLKLAAEYNGEQHYKFPNRFHKTQREFMSQVRRDRLKIEMCELQGIHLISIPWSIGHSLIPDFIKYHLPENVRAREQGKPEPIKHNWTEQICQI